MSHKGIFFIILVAHCAAFADDCPTGYSVLDDSGLCKIQCNAGYYVATAGGTCEPLNWVQYYIGANTVTYGEVSRPIQCPDDGFIPSAWNNGGHSSISRCIKTIYGLRFVMHNKYCSSPNYSTHGTGIAPCYWRCNQDNECGYNAPDPNGNPMGCVGGSELKTCDAGYYATIVSNGEGLQNHPCVPVGMGYYSPDGDLNRYACPENTVTCGRGDCAASVSDCVPYKTLHIGEIEIKMPSRQYTTPSLAAAHPDGNVYYAQSSARNIAHGLKVKYNNQTYSIINAEDDFCPNGADPNP